MRDERVASALQATRRVNTVLDIRGCSGGSSNMKICYQHPDQEQLREALADRRGGRRQA